MVVIRVDLITNEGIGIKINDLFNEWLRCDSHKTHGIVMEKLVKLRFGSYDQFSVLDIVKSWGWNQKMYKGTWNNFRSEVQRNIDGFKGCTSEHLYWCFIDQKTKSVYDNKG